MVAFREHLLVLLVLLDSPLLKCSSLVFVITIQNKRLQMQGWRRGVVVSGVRQ